MTSRKGASDTGQAKRRAGWTKAKTDAFLDALRQTANVTAACRAAKTNTQAAYKRRGDDPVFRAAWHDALCEGYGTLEQLLLSQAISGLKPSRTIATASGPRLKISERTVLSLLSLHRQTVRELRAAQGIEASITPAEDEDARAEIEASFAIMGDRLRASADADVGGDKEGGGDDDAA